jgi:hypothetical protein
LNELEENIRLALCFLLPLSSIEMMTSFSENFLPFVGLFFRKISLEANSLNPSDLNSKRWLLFARTFQQFAGLFGENRWIFTSGMSLVKNILTKSTHAMSFSE